VEGGCLENLAVKVSRTRMIRLKEYEGCTVKYCVAEKCFEGVLVDVDLEAALVKVETPSGETVTPFLPDEFELTVHDCPGGEE